MKRISDIVSVEEIRSWSKGEMVFIDAPTGSGKSYWLKNILYDHAKSENKKILMFLHRTNTKDQFQIELDEANKSDEYITIMTYQSLESLIENLKTFNFSKYDYICMDEIHYMMEDSQFNYLTFLSLEAILEQEEKIRISMTATGKYIEKYLTTYRKFNIKKYHVEADFSFIEKLAFFNKDSTMESILAEAVESDTKSIFFVQSAKKAYELHRLHKDKTMFVCSSNNSTYYKHVDKEKLSNMLKNEHFEEKVLITTTCLDAGVNIIDLDLKHIVLDVKNVNTLIQCIGRKRIQNEDDNVEVYIKSISNNQLAGMKVQLNNKLEKARFLRKNGTNEYVKKFGRQLDYSQIIYDDTVGERDKCTKKVNEMMFFKCSTDIYEINQMLKLERFGYYKYLSKILGFYDKENDEYMYIPLEDDRDKDKLVEYLDSIVGKKLFKDEQQEMKEVFVENGLKARSLGINTMNGNLKDRGLSFLIEVGKRKSYRDESGKVKKEKSHWIVAKITYS